jgi:hypothetical protein
VVATTAPAAERPRTDAAAKEAVGTATVVRTPAAVRPGRLVLSGLAWAGLLLASADLGQLALAVVVVPVAVVAAVSVVRGLHRRQKAVAPTVAMAAGAAVVLPLTAIAGPGAALGVGIFLAVAAAVQVILVSRRVGFALVVTFASLAPAVAAAAVVAARGQGLSEALTLLTAVCLYDMASFLTGTGPRGGVVGALVGMVTLGVLAVFVAAVVEPPFSGRSPWVLLGLVALLAPVGVFLAGRICSERRLPALRRLDSLILAGPAWVIAVGLLLHR